MKFKNIFVSLLIALSISSVSFCQDQEIKGDYFGNARFGSTKEEIKEVEKTSKLVLDKNDELIFNETSEFMGNSQNVYSFDKDGKMNTAMISVINDHKDLANYIADYNKINEAFIQVYGEPDENVFTTQDEELLNNPAKLAEAIKEGKVVASTIWNKPNFTISHLLADQMKADDMDDETKKVTVFTPISHLVLGQLNSADSGEDEAEDIDAE